MSQSNDNIVELNADALMFDTVQAQEKAYRDASVTPWSRRLMILWRLWKRTKIVDRGYHSPCYEWTGPTSGSGRGGLYGRMSLDGATVATHIAAWTNEHGLIPPKKQLDHKCSNRKCWRQDHLELVTHKTNQKRRAARRKSA